jgi:hypothetical protein
MDRYIHTYICLSQMPGGFMSISDAYSFLKGKHLWKKQHVKSYPLRINWLLEGITLFSTQVFQSLAQKSLQESLCNNFLPLERLSLVEGGKEGGSHAGWILRQTEAGDWFLPPPRLKKLNLPGICGEGCWEGQWFNFWAPGKKKPTGSQRRCSSHLDALG